VIFALITGALSRAIDYSDSLLSDRYTHYVSVRVMRQAARLDLTTYETLTSTTASSAPASRPPIGWP